MIYSHIIRDYLLNLAKSYNGHLEIGNTNRSDIIDIIQAEFNTRGQQYCAMFVWYIYQQAFLLCGLNNPIPKTASTQTMFGQLKKLYPKAVFTGYTQRHKIQPGDIVIWRKHKLWQGHTGIVLENNILKDNSIITIEANTSAPSAPVSAPVSVPVKQLSKLPSNEEARSLSSPDPLSSDNSISGCIEAQRNGNGIFIRKRSVNKIDFNVDSFWYRGFISFNELYHQQSSLKSLSSL